MLVTRFSLEELDYLKGLTVVTSPRARMTDQRRQAFGAGWVDLSSQGRASEFWTTCATRPDCEGVFGHLGPDGTTYYRHGEALAKVPGPFDHRLVPYDVAAAILWIAGCHLVAENHDQIREVV